tara:strand:+ start:5969 stop:6340 length:372 start_codon:yes stop_codon:yes gene_type:complete
MTAAQLRDRFPNASDQFIARNSDRAPRREGKGAKLERAHVDAPLAAPKAEGRDSGKFFVRVTSRRRRLLDEDNLSAKWFVDCCRYAGLIPGDGPGQTRIETRQEKVRTVGEESTVIEIFSPTG